MTKPGFLLVISIATAAIAAAAVAYATSERSPEALVRPRGAQDELPANAGFLRHLDAGSARRVASFRLAGGRERAVYLAKTRDGEQLCLWDTDLATGEQGGGCNPADAFFGERSLLVSLGYEGGPSRSSIRDVRIIGLATPPVASVIVELSGGAERPVKLTRDRGFAWVMPEADLRQGLEPVAVIARDATGRVLDRRSTGF